MSKLEKKSKARSCCASHAKYITW